MFTFYILPNPIQPSNLIYWQLFDDTNCLLHAFLEIISGEFSSLRHKNLITQGYNSRMYFDTPTGKNCLQYWVMILFFNSIYFRWHPMGDWLWLCYTVAWRILSACWIRKQTELFTKNNETDKLNILIIQKNSPK